MSKSLKSLNFYVIPKVPSLRVGRIDERKENRKEKKKLRNQGLRESGNLGGGGGNALSSGACRRVRTAERGCAGGGCCGEGRRDNEYR